LDFAGEYFARGRRYGVALVCESVLLFSATYLLVSGKGAGDFLAAMACGLQNALATSYSGAVIRTTHITGIITDLGLAAGAALRGDRVDVRRTGLYALLALGFTGGSVLGGLGYVAMVFRVLPFPAMITGIAGLGYPPTRFAKAGSKDPPRRLFDFSLLNDWLSSSRLGLEQDRETQHRVFWGASIRDDGRLRDDDR